MFLALNDSFVSLSVRGDNEILVKGKFSQIKEFLDKKSYGIGFFRSFLWVYFCWHFGFQPPY